MKKLMFSITLLLLAAFVITACSSTPPVAPTSTVGAAPTSTVAATAAATGTTVATAGATAAATTAATSVATSATTPAATTSATAGATTAATSAATTAATTAATVGATSALVTTTTPQVSVTQTTGPAASGVSGQFVRLSILLQSSISTNGETGKISGIVLGQPTVSVNSGAATATPAPGQAPVPYVRYVLANMSGSSSSTAKEILLPWNMFSFATTSTSNGLVSQNFTLNGSAASRANVPQVSLPSQTGVLQSGWDSQLSQYWASQGFAIPVTGTTQGAETDVLLRNTVNGANIVDQKNQALGQASDFLIDPSNGQFTFAVFNGGQLFGNRTFVVPVRDLIFQLNSANASGLGNIQLNFPSTILNTAPSINLNQLQLNPALLQQIIAFWQTIQSTK